jgi:hypothetical protein
MGYNKLNYQRFLENSSFFKIKFKREPKVWTIGEVHDLYLRTLERHNIRLNKLIEVRDRIVNETPEIEKGKRIVYFTLDDKIYQRDFNYYREYDSWGTSTSSVKFTSNNIVITRDEKLEFILSNDKQFELGELYQSMKGESKCLHLFIWHILSEMVEEKLRAEFKGKSSPEILTVNISGYKYYVVCDKQHMYDHFYKRFELKNRENESIEL